MCAHVSQVLGNDAAGFRLESVKPTVTPFDILEAVAA
jgi:hypothetical protein